MTAIHPDDEAWNSPEDAAYDQPRPKRGSRSTDIPKIRLLSWPGMESVVWGVVIAHIIKWAVSFAYFATFQVRYAVGYGKGLWTVLYLKDWWDRLPVHIANLLRQPWFSSQAEPLWWITWRHDIRDVTIAVVATIIVELMFAKPKYPVDDNPGLRVYLTSVPLAIGAALLPIAVVAVLAWKLPWLTGHGLSVPAHYGVVASEANGWIEAGTWITVLMGIAGGLVAKKFIQRVADDIQWFFAERSAAKIRNSTGLNALRGGRVIGTPAHRARVHWLLDHVTLSELPERSRWLVWVLLAAGFFTLAYGGAGAWLNLVGPAAPH